MKEKSHSCVHIVWWDLKKSLALICHIETIHSESSEKSNEFSMRNNNSVHEKKSKVSCPLCDAVLGNKTSLKAHIESIHEGKRRVCDICGHSAVYSQRIREHIKIVHEGKKIAKKV